MDLVIGTWSFCFDSIKTEEEVLKNHGSCLDVVEKIINSACILLSFQINRYFHFQSGQEIIEGKAKLLLL